MKGRGRQTNQSGRKSEPLRTQHGLKRNQSALKKDGVGTGSALPLPKPKQSQTLKRSALMPKTTARRPRPNIFYPQPRTPSSRTLTRRSPQSAPLPKTEHLMPTPANARQGAPPQNDPNQCPKMSRNVPNPSMQSPPPRARAKETHPRHPPSVQLRCNKRQPNAPPVPSPLRAFVPPSLPHPPLPIQQEMSQYPPTRTAGCNEPDNQHFSGKIHNE